MHTRAIDLLNAIYLACFAIIMVMIISRGMMLIIRGRRESDEEAGMTEERELNLPADFETFPEARKRRF